MHNNGTYYRIKITPDVLRLEGTNGRAYAYQLARTSDLRRDKRIWVRHQDEMEDGRFTKVTNFQGG